MSDQKVVTLYPPKPSVLETIDEFAEIADEIDCLLMVGISKDQKTFHIMTNGMTSYQKYAIAGLVQAWVTECSIELGWQDEKI